MRDIEYKINERYECTIINYYLFARNSTMLSNRANSEM